MVDFLSEFDFGQNLDLFSLYFEISGNYYCVFEKYNCVICNQ